MMLTIKKIWSNLCWKKSLLIAKLKHPKEGKHTIMCLAAGYTFNDIDYFLDDDDADLTIQERREAYCSEEVTYWEE